VSRLIRRGIQTWPNTTLCLRKKVGYFNYYDNFVKRGPIFIKKFFTVKIKKDLRGKLELELPPRLKSVATLPCET